MHIILISRWYPPHTGYGGVAAYSSYLARSLARLGHRVSVVAARWSPDVPAMEEQNGITIYRLLARYHYWPRRIPVLGQYVRPLRQLRYSMQIAHKLRALEAVDPPDVVEFAEVEAEGFAYLRSKQHRPVVVRCHTPTFVLRRYYTRLEAPFDTSLTAAMERYCIRHADALSAPSYDMARTIGGECDIALDRFAVIPNALDVDLFSGCQEQKEVEKVSCPAADVRRVDDRVTILHVGRLERVKGVETLIHAIPQVLQNAPNATFVFAGDDRPDGAGSTWRQRLEAYARGRGFSHKVRFLGPVDQSTLIEWYRKADIAVVPSMLYESFSYTCAQAMAAGLPIVASRIGGVPETVGDCGLLVPSADVDALSNALVDLIRKPELRSHLGSVASERARNCFDAPIVAAQTVLTYLKVVHRAL